jgi:hypothetical protein
MLTTPDYHFSTLAELAESGGLKMLHSTQQS